MGPQAQAAAAFGHAFTLVGPVSHQTPRRSLSEPRALKAHGVRASEARRLYAAFEAAPLASAVTAVLALRRGSAGTGRRRLRCATLRRAQMRDSLDAIRQSLQGDWENGKGLVIQVDGSEVDFKDGTGPWKLEEALVQMLPVETTKKTIMLRGARLCSGLPDLPLWQFPDGTEFFWTRPDPAQLLDEHWRGVFLTYKCARLLLRRKLAQALAQGDSVTVDALSEAWDGGWGFQSGTPLERQARLAAGRDFIVGCCVRHKQYGVRGVIIACEPWVGARLARQLPAGPDSRLQPLYHVLLDERDVPGSHATLVPESDLEACDEAFPVQGDHVARHLERADNLRGYLPGPELMESIRRQLHDQPLSIRGS
ncbi:unnamed protein product [Polarella glacialis]|uniref:Hemimethylated DNA-binding domain-containing protein n=1 Tax=Polarella glacialis TaxID=89957 RepID=A0A813GU84_POLGL|nr:unnamed protein product [Polarella glacialis]